MILLSALLASFTGLVSGERQVMPARVERSAQALVAQMEAVVARKAQAAEALPVAPRPAAIPRVLAAPAFAAPVLALDSVLSLKQSWLE